MENSSFYNRWERFWAMILYFSWYQFIVANNFTDRIVFGKKRIVFTPTKLISYAKNKKRKKDMEHREYLFSELLDPKDGYFITLSFKDLILIYIYLYATPVMCISFMIENIAVDNISEMVGISRKIVSNLFVLIYLFGAYYGLSKLQSMLFKNNRYLVFFKEFSKKSKIWHRRRVALPTILVISSGIILYCVVCILY